MKKQLAAALAVITIFLCTNVQAQEDENVNPLNVARAFALKTPSTFQCYVQGESLIDNAWTRTVIEFTVRKSDWAITSMTINDEVIPLPEPINGLPMGNGGLMRNVYVSVSAFTKGNEYAGSGDVWLNQIMKDDSIEVLLRPADIRYEIPIDVSRYGSDIQVEIEDFIYGYGYGTGLGGKFYIYLPPISGRYHYILRRFSTGEIIGEGWIEPFRDVVTADNAYFGVRYIGNVVGVEFSEGESDDWVTLPKLKFDCSIPATSGDKLAGKVIFADMGLGGLEIIISSNVDIYVQQASGEGDMPFLELVDRSVRNNNYTETRVHTQKQRLGKVIITVVPKEGAEDDGRWLNIHRYYGQPSLPSNGPKG